MRLGIVWWVICMAIGMPLGAQTYMPMPTDSATWRIRDYEIDFVTHVFDAMLFVRPGDDTLHEGHTYRNVWSRAYRHVVTDGVFPPMTDIDAMYPDTWMAAYREEGRKLYQMQNTGEKLLYDFTAEVGDPIPGRVGWDTVTATDSVLLGGIYHKRYLTTRTGYEVIEGVGSSYGLLPAMNDGTGAYKFLCFSQPATGVQYTPDATVPCTYVYPIHSHSAVADMPGGAGIPWAVFPVPAVNRVSIEVVNSGAYMVTITNIAGQKWWTNRLHATTTIDVGLWPRGIYCVLITDHMGHTDRRTLLLQ